MVTQALLVAAFAFTTPANACDARADALERAIDHERREGRRLDDDFDELAEAARELLMAERSLMQEPARARSERRRCAKRSRRLVRELAYRLHRELDPRGAADDADNAEYSRALSIYDLWLARFGLSGPDVYEMHYFRAELLWLRADRSSWHGAPGWRAQFGAVAQAFTEVLELNPRGRYTRDAAWAQLLATAKAVDLASPPGCPKCGYESPACYYPARPNQGRPYPDVGLGWRGTRYPAATRSR